MFQIKKTSVFSRWILKKTKVCRFLRVTTSLAGNFRPLCHILDSLFCQ